MKIVQVLSIVAVAFHGFMPTVTAIADSLVDDSCAYNTFMCCFTENEVRVEDNTDVCRVLDSPYPGITREFPGETEGDVHCHGFVWSHGASLESFIKPLYNYVRNFGHREARGYSGNVKGARMCECIEKMPVVSRADCTTYSPQGLVSCEGNDLRTHYYNEMRRPGGNIRFNLVETCDNEDEDEI